MRNIFFLLGLIGILVVPLVSGSGIVVSGPDYQIGYGDVDRWIYRRDMIAL